MGLEGLVPTQNTILHVIWQWDKSYCLHFKKMLASAFYFISGPLDVLAESWGGNQKDQRICPGSLVGFVILT